MKNKKGILGITMVVTPLLILAFIGILAVVIFGFGVLWKMVMYLGGFVLIIGAIYLMVKYPVIIKTPLPYLLFIFALFLFVVPTLTQAFGWSIMPPTELTDSGGNVVSCVSDIDCEELLDQVETDGTIKCIENICKLQRGGS